ncbi:hypothetical protein WJX74_001573 [Apatococcus lobatus]|uniref:Uncharacterized protein n=1 Tax=Apatococcus lobatus TaxID=904363 RepID=A0AAW1SE12_9CHLO
MGTDSGETLRTMLMGWPGEAFTTADFLFTLVIVFSPALLRSVSGFRMSVDIPLAVLVLFLAWVVNLCRTCNMPENSHVRARSTPLAEETAPETKHVPPTSPSSPPVRDSPRPDWTFLAPPTVPKNPDPSSWWSRCFCPEVWRGASDHQKASMISKYAAWCEMPDSKHVWPCRADGKKCGVQLRDIVGKMPPNKRRLAVHDLTHALRKVLPDDVLSDVISEFNEDTLFVMNMFENGIDDR